MSYALAGALIGGIANIFASDEQNERIREAQRKEVANFKSIEAVSLFAQANNSERGKQLSTQLGAAEAAAHREVGVAEQKAIGKEVIRRGEGITAGRSVERSVDDVLAQGAKAQQKVSSASDAKWEALNRKVQKANQAEYMTRDKAYNTMSSNVASYESQIKSPFEAFLGGVTGMASGAQSGAKIDELDKLGAFDSIKNFQI